MIYVVTDRVKSEFDKNSSVAVLAVVPTMDRALEEAKGYPTAKIIEHDMTEEQFNEIMAV